MEEAIKKSYYEEMLPSLIQKLKNMVEKNMEIIDQDTDDDISSDKFHAVLRGRKQAAEDCIWCAKHIDQLEKELSGEEAEEIIPKKSWAKRAAEKK